MKLNSLNFKINGIVWVAGHTGNPEKEINNPELIKHNYYINLVNPILVINHLIPKLADDSFISVITSVGGMRGRSKRIFYGSAKAGLINYLSGLIGVPIEIVSVGPKRNQIIINQ